MRKLFWCGSAAGVLALGSLFAVAYYAGCQPDSIVGRCIAVVANASVAVQPVTGLASMLARASHQAMNPQETAGMAGSNEECIPEDPQPVAAEDPQPVAVEPVEIAIVENPVREVEPEAAPIVIHEETVEELPAPATIEISGLPAGPDNVCPMVMPYCADDEQSAVKPIMPYAEDDGVKPAAAIEESEDSEFKAWMKLFEESGQADKDAPVEELPAPKEGSPSEPKCQEDSRIHEHYSGCPSMTCPYTGKSYPSVAPATKPGQEESSEEPALKPKQHGKKHSGKGKDSCPHTEGVDTMEYRPSDGGLNEYGRGPL